MDHNRLQHGFQVMVKHLEFEEPVDDAYCLQFRAPSSGEPSLTFLPTSGAGTAAQPAAVCPTLHF